MNTGERMKRLRKEKNLSGKEMATILGISQGYYYDIERGDKRPNTEIISKLSEFFGVTSDYLLGTKVNFQAVENNKSPAGETPEGILDMDDIEIFKRFSFRLDGEPIDEEEARGLLAYLRTVRKMK